MLAGMRANNVSLTWASTSPGERGVPELSGELQHTAGGGHHQRCRHPLARRVAHDHSQPPLGKKVEVVEVSSHLSSRLVEGGDLPAFQLGHLLWAARHAGCFVLPLSCSTRSSSILSCSRLCPLSFEPSVPRPHSSAILPSTMRWMTMALLVNSLPLGATPISSPRSWVKCTMKRVTTLSPPATWSSTSNLRLERAAANRTVTHSRLRGRAVGRVAVWRG